MRTSIALALLLASCGAFAQDYNGTTAPVTKTPVPVAVPVAVPVSVPHKAAVPAPPVHTTVAEPVHVGRNINTWLRTTPLLSTTFQVAIAGGINALASDNTTVSTCFFPSDSAWVKFLAGVGLTRQQLLDNGPLVQKLARSMVVPHVALRTMDFAPGQKLATLQEETLTIRPTSDVYVVVGGRSSAAIIVPDLQADLSIVNIVDTVIVPSAVNLPKI